MPRVHSQIPAVKVTARSSGQPALPGNCDSLTCSRQDTPLTVGSHFGSRRTGLQRDWLPSGIGRSALTCEDVFAGIGCEGSSAALAMQEVKDHLQDRNRLLNCDNAELRGFEPLTSCMPCLTVSSDGIALGRITAGQRNLGVWVRRAVSVVAWRRCHLDCHWLSGYRKVAIHMPLNLSLLSGETSLRWRRAIG